MNFIKKFSMRRKIDYSLIGVALIFIFSFVVMSIAVYKSEIIFKGFNRSHYYVYYLLSFLGISLSFALCFTTKETRVKIVLVLTALLVSIYASEIFLGFTSRVNDNKMNERKYLDELIKKDKNAVPRLIPGFFVESNGIGVKNKIFPLAGISNRLTVHCNESGEMITYFSDRHGFNNPDSVWKNNPAIITIGDSFTQGDCVPQSNTIASNLRNITGQNVINLGMGGNGPLIEFATLAEYGRRVKSQYVLWIFFEGNDLFELATEQQSNILLSYLEGTYDQSLIFRQAEIDNALLHWLQAANHNRDSYTINDFFFLKRLRGLLLSIIYQGTPKRNLNSTWPLMNSILIEAKKMTNSWGGKFIFVYLPSYARYSGDLLDQDAYLDKKAVIESVRRLQIPVIDIHEDFLNDKDPLRFFPHRKNGHYNEEGYLMVSRSLAEKLQLNNFGNR
jgi:hypothetical protein